MIVKEDGTLDTSKLELAEGTKFVVTSSSYDDLEFSYSLYSYVYAGLTWGEYWSQESVTAAGNVSGSDEKDSHNESDTGAFDAVTRATTNHGLHRGSFQAIAVLMEKQFLTGAQTEKQFIMPMEHQKYLTGTM
mgnify:CR=1 FL=1